MAVVRTPDEFEAELARYLYERSEEGRAVRVGEKETSEQAAIVERYADLFTREQHDALREAEEDARGEERERLYRLREAAAGGVIVARARRGVGQARERDPRRARRVPRRVAAAPLGPGAARASSTTTRRATSWATWPPTRPPASTARATA